MSNRSHIISQDTWSYECANIPVHSGMVDQPASFPAHRTLPNFGLGSWFPSVVDDSSSASTASVETGVSASPGYSPIWRISGGEFAPEDSSSRFLLYIQTVNVNCTLVISNDIITRTHKMASQKFISSCLLDLCSNIIHNLVSHSNITGSTDPVFRIQNNLIVRKPKAKYLGHIISEDMSDDADVFRQVKCLYIQGNIISRTFANCSINVKLVVFKTYCSCLYTSQLWGTCLSRTMNRLKVAYNDSLRMVLGIPRYCSASEMFAYTNVPSCQCVIRLNIYSFMKRIQCVGCSHIV